MPIQFMVSKFRTNSHRSAYSWSHFAVLTVGVASLQHVEINHCMIGCHSTPFNCMRLTNCESLTVKGDKISQTIECSCRFGLATSCLASLGVYLASALLSSRGGLQEGQKTAVPLKRGCFRRGSHRPARSLANVCSVRV